jgi:hypothetical protein
MHPFANCLSIASSAANSAGLSGAFSVVRNAFNFAAGRHEMGSDLPTPRGSNPTMS